MPNIKLKQSPKKYRSKLEGILWEMVESISSVGYTKEEKAVNHAVDRINEIIKKAKKQGFERGYDEAEVEVKMNMAKYCRQ